MRFLLVQELILRLLINCVLRLSFVDSVHFHCYIFQCTSGAIRETLQVFTATMEKLLETHRECWREYREEARKERKERERLVGQ